MTVITRATNIGFDAVSLQECNKIPGLEAGETLQKWDACRIDSTNGKVFRANSGCVVTTTYTSGSSTSSKYESMFAGFVITNYTEGQPVTLVRNGAMGTYSSSLTPGNPLWVAATSGSLSSASPVVNLDKPVAMVVSTTKIMAL
jgi:hypothetical protein